MNEVNSFFSLKNTVQSISNEESEQLSNYLLAIDAFSRTTYKSIYVIDYHQQCFDYVSDNPLFLCGHTAQEVKEMGYSFYFKFVVEDDLDLLLKINKAGFDFYERIAVEERPLYTISYDFRLKNNDGNIILVNHKLTPLFINKDGKIWKSFCIVSLSEKQSSGNIKIYKQNESKYWNYDLEGDFWETSESITLTDREKEILYLSIQGLTVGDIARRIFISPDTVKFHRRKLFDKLGVANITEAISFATNNRLL